MESYFNIIYFKGIITLKNAREKFLNQLKKMLNLTVPVKSRLNQIGIKNVAVDFVN